MADTKVFDSVNEVFAEITHYLQQATDNEKIAAYNKIFEDCLVLLPDGSIHDPHCGPVLVNKATAKYTIEADFYDGLGNYSETRYLDMYSKAYLKQPIWTDETCKSIELTDRAEACDYARVLSNDPSITVKVILNGNHVVEMYRYGKEL